MWGQLKNSETLNVIYCSIMYRRFQKLDEFGGIAFIASVNVSGAFSQSAL
jgi:hypothetical protein